MPVSRLPRRAALGAMFALPALAQGQGQGMADWPGHPVRFIGVFPPGGGTDIISRLWCQRMSEITGQPFAIENRSGSGGNIGTEAIARAVPDGRSIGLASVAPLSISPTLYRSLPFDVTKDFSYISGMYQLPNLLVVPMDLPVRSVPELIALLRAKPGEYAYASAGPGTSLHIAGAMFASMAGLDIAHVPYRGGTGVQMDLIAGRVHLMFDNFPSAIQHVRAGRLRGLAVTSAKRSDIAPELPTMAEFLPGFAITSWGGVMAPAGLPVPLVAQIAALSHRALADPGLIGRFQENGATPWPVGPTELAAFRAADEKAFAPVIRASGAVVD